MTMGKLPFILSYRDGEKHLRLVMEKEKLTIEEANSLATHLTYFVQEMDTIDETEAIGEMMMAQHDDDPNPYHGDYSEE